MTFKLIEWLKFVLDWLTDCLTNSLINWELSDWGIDRLVDWMTDWLTDRQIHWFFDWLFNGRFVYWLTYWLIDRPNHSLTARFVLINHLVDWSHLHISVYLFKTRLYFTWVLIDKLTTIDHNPIAGKMSGPGKCHTQP